MPWLKVLGWSACGGAVGYALPMVLCYGFLAELRKADRPTVVWLGIRSAEGIDPAALLGAVVMLALACGVLAAVITKPWRPATEE
jgi:hypothetical protein